MSGDKTMNAAGVKRKRITSKPEHTKKSRKHRDSASEESDASENVQVQILYLEKQVLESRKHFNNIATLLNLTKEEESEDESPILAAVALCRVFCRLFAQGDMAKNKGMGESERVILAWLKERYREYIEVLLNDFMRSEQGPRSSVVLTLVTRLIKEEAKSQKEYSVKNGLLPRLIVEILSLSPENPAFEDFTERYFKQFDDIRCLTFIAIKNILDSELDRSSRKVVINNSLTLLSQLSDAPTSETDISTLYLSLPKGSVASLRSYREKAQAAYITTIRAGLDSCQTKSILTTFSHHIAPWFLQPELLMDFLTDAYNIGGSTSLLALSGLYYLISEKNLDYPLFYTKLYSLLDGTLLHSKHRSRFFRLLDTFMSSTHLPAVLVASFIKRLSRLALHAPPAGIVIVVPWVYNMFQRHPACTFMMHRSHPPVAKDATQDEAMLDPFDMSEPDPMLTLAVESCVWELEALQSHYHPNVATLARVISEQFTKRSYHLEDFLDLSYRTLLDTDLGREVKKEPEGEFEIPKRIFTAEEGGLNALGQLLGMVQEAR